jgi:hypothetical protein
MRHCVVSIAAFSLVILAASEAATAASVKACSLITQQTASGIFGGPVQPGEEDVPGNLGTECRFNALGGMSNSSVYAGMMSASMFGANNTAIAFRATITGDTGSKVEPVSGLGEAAYFVINVGGEQSINVLYHGQIIKIGAVNSKNPGLKSATIAVAKQFMSKI